MCIRDSRRIDRAFFRSAYDARVILENLASTSRTAANRDVLASLLLNQLNACLLYTSRLFVIQLK